MPLYLCYIALHTQGISFPQAMFWSGDCINTNKKRMQLSFLLPLRSPFCVYCHIEISIADHRNIVVAHEDVHQLGESDATRNS